MKKLPILVVLSSAHEDLYEKYFLPTLPEGAEVILKDLGKNTDDGSFLSAEWQDAMCAKIRHALGFCERAEEGQLFLVSDVDVQFFPSFDTGKFAAYFDSLCCDLAFQKERMRKGDAEVNCGFYAGRNTLAVRSLLKASLQRIESDAIKNEQVVINNMMESMAVPFAFLDQRFYARSHGFPPSADVWIHHANWTTTIDQKVDQLDRVRRVLKGGRFRLIWESYGEFIGRLIARKPGVSEIVFEHSRFLESLRNKPFRIP